MFGGNTVRSFTILLDNPSRSYFAGQMVSGRLILDVERERKTSGIKLNFVGRATARWKEHHTVHTGTGSQRRSHTETRTISDSETYFDNKFYVLGNSGGPDIQIPPGYHEFTFSFHLPMGIPSSFKGTYGHIQYSVTGTLKKSWGFDKTTTAIFTVNGIVDLNTWPGAGSISHLTKQKHLGFLCCKDGPIGFIFQLNRSGYVPGEGLDIIVEMNNQSSVSVRGMQIRLIRNVSFHARGKCKTESDRVTGFSGPGVGPGDTEIWERSPTNTKIPSIPPTNLGGCRLIHVHYFIHVEMEISSGFNLKGSMEVIIGTIPFRNNFEHMRNRFSEPIGIVVSPAEGVGFSGDSLFPSAPPFTIAGYPDLPPPSYEDAFSEGGLPSYSEALADGNNSENDKKNGNRIAYDPSFVPKYATYG